MSRTGDWIQTYTGLKFWPLDPDPADVRVEDIAHALSLRCQYGGHCLRFFSVAQHSCLVHDTAVLHVENCNLDILRWALMHDAAEAYLGDILGPIKRCLPVLRTVEEQCLYAISRALKLTWPMPGQTIKQYDRAVQAAQYPVLMRQADEWKSLRGVAPANITIRVWSALDAEAEFLDRWRRLQ